MRSSIALAAAALLVGGAASAQHSILFAVENDTPTLDVGDGLLEAGTLHPDEVGIVTPAPGTFYSASTFVSIGAQFIWLGDADGDDRVVDASTTGPGADTDALLVRRFPAPPTGVVDPSEIFLSKEDDAEFAAGFEDGDVFRYTPGGGIEVFVTEALILETVGQPTGDVDVDAFAQSELGDLFFSFDLTEDVNGVSAEDGALIYVPAGAVTYDANFNVSAVVPASAAVVASEDDMIAFMMASGMLTSVGGTPSTSFELSGLDLDPSGGTWDSPQLPGLLLPNLAFTWGGFSNDGAIVSTAGGGSIPVINGVPTASTVATTGLQVGLAPDSTGLDGIMGLELVPLRPDPLVIEVFPTRLITSSTILFTREEVSGATPLGPVAFVATPVPSNPGTTVPVLSLPGFAGSFYGDPSEAIVTGIDTATPGGHAEMIHFLPPALVGTGGLVVWQAVDVATLAFSTPSGIQFL